MTDLDVNLWNEWAAARSGGKWCDLHDQNGWVYGYWVCGRPHGARTLLYGQYPHSFLERALRLFYPDGIEAGDPRESRLLHAPSGILTRNRSVAEHWGLPVTPGIMLDIAGDWEFDPEHPPVEGQKVPRWPTVVASVADMPFEDEHFDVVLSDPPYAHLGETYGTGKFPLKGLVEEAYRVLRPGGYFGMLHTYTGPPRSNKLWETRGVIAVAPSTQLNWTRTFCILRKR